jgi:hypothetical protein
MAARRRALLGLLAAVLTAEAVVVDTTKALHAALARREATIDLGADLALGGEPLVVAGDCDLRGHAHTLFQVPDTRHVRVNGPVAFAVSDVTLVLVDPRGLGTHAQRHARQRHGAGSMSSLSTTASVRKGPSLFARPSIFRGASGQSPAPARVASEHSGGLDATNGTRASKKQVMFKTLTWNSKDDSEPHSI